MALKELLINAAQDHQIAERLRANPAKLIKEYELSDDEQEALLSGNKEQITQLIAGDEPVAAAVVVMVTIFMEPLINSTSIL